MKIAFTTEGIEWESKIDPRFGRAEFLLFYNDENNEFLYYDNRKVAEVAHGAGPQTAQKLFDFHPDVLITGNGPGGNAATVLEKSGVKIFIGAGDMTVKQALDAYKNNKLKKF